MRGGAEALASIHRRRWLRQDPAIPDAMQPAWTAGIVEGDSLRSTHTDCFRGHLKSAARLPL